MHPSAEAIGLAPALAVGLRSRPRQYRLAAAPRRRRLGVALVFAAFVTRAEPLANHTFLWAHLLQNVVLAEWAPALLVLAVPPRLAERAAGFPLFRPFVALPLWLADVLHLAPAWIYDTALRHPHSLLHVEHLTYLAAGICVWWPVVHGRSSAGAKAAYLFAAFVLASPLGLLLALIPRAIYPFYVHAPRTWGPGPLADQQIAGVTMAAEEAIVFFGAFTASCCASSPTSRRAGAQPERVGACSRRSAGWPSRSSRLRSASALTSAPRSSAIAASQSHVSMMITAASDPQVLLYEPKSRCRRRSRPRPRARRRPRGRHRVSEVPLRVLDVRPEVEKRREGGEQTDDEDRPLARSTRSTRRRPRPGRRAPRRAARATGRRSSRTATRRNAKPITATSSTATRRLRTKERLSFRP